MKMFSLLMSLLFILMKTTECKEYYDCKADDCSFFDFPDDPRNFYTNLFLQVESNLNSTLSIPSWKMWLEFYDGHLSLNINEFTDECSCPLISKEDKVFVTFHSRDILDVWYSYKLPSSEGNDGAVQLSCSYTFSAVLMDQKKHPPVFQKVDVTTLYIFNITPYGAPLEWYDDLPIKYKAFIEKALYTPIRNLLETTLLQAFNDQLNILYGTVPSSDQHDNLVD